MFFQGRCIDICRYAFKLPHIGGLKEKQENSEKTLTFVSLAFKIISL